MGHLDGAHTHGSGSGGLAQAALAVLTVVFGAAVLGPVVAAVSALVHVLLIAAAVVLGVAAAALVALAAFRVHRWRAGGTTRVSFCPPPP
jgi:hypothetical protein